MSSNLSLASSSRSQSARKHNIHYYGFYSSRARALRKQDNLKIGPESPDERDSKTHEPELSQKAPSRLQRNDGQI